MSVNIRHKRKLWNEGPAKGVEEKSRNFFVKTKVPGSDSWPNFKWDFDPTVSYASFLLKIELQPKRSITLELITGLVQAVSDKFKFVTRFELLSQRLGVDNLPSTKQDIVEEMCFRRELHQQMESWLDVSPSLRLY